MSPELETLDQLLGGDMPLTVIRALYPDAPSFARGVLGLLAAGDVRLLENGIEVPRQRWREVLAGDLAGYRLAITDAGTARVA